METLNTISLRIIHLIAVSLCCSVFCSLAIIASPDSKIKTEDSLFAVILHKEGILSPFWHNHLICANQYQIKLEAKAKELHKSKFYMTISVKDLQADPQERKQRWGPRLIDLGVVESFDHGLTEIDIKKISDKMLSEDHLNADKFPTIKVQTKSIRQKTTIINGNRFPYEVVIALTMQDKTVEKPFSANIFVEKNHYLVEALGSFNFSDFSLIPASMLFGTARNKDEFHIYVNFRTLGL